MTVQNDPGRAGAERIIGLDLVRAAAICGVVLTHLAVLTVQRWPVTTVFSGCGFVGVEAFFALSGFLIGGILYQSYAAGTLSLPAFWRRRWLRTIPAYLVFLAANTVVSIMLGARPAGHWRYLVYLQNFNWPHPAFYPEAWSLAVEEWFYLLAPLLLLAVGRLLPRKHAFWATAGLLIGCSLVYRLVYVGLANPSWEQGVRKIVLLRLDAIGTGVLMAYGYHRGLFVKRLVRVILGLVGAVLVVGSGAGGLAIALAGRLDSSYFARTWLFLICPLGTALTLPYFAGVRQLPGRLLSGRLMTGVVRYVAMISYSVYLCNHLIVSIIVTRLPASRWPILVQVALFLVSTLVVATGSYFIVERPFISLYRRLGKAGPGNTATLPRLSVH